MRTLPTPCARDGKGPGHQHGLPDLIERQPAGLQRERLLPTPTAVAYGSNRSPSSGAAVRPSLDGVVRRLPPTSTVAGTRVSATTVAGRRRSTVHTGQADTDVGRLLPTPRGSDSHGPGRHGTGGADLRTTVAYLPTPRATDGVKGCPAQRGSKGDLTLPSAAVAVTVQRPDGSTDPSGDATGGWGVYADAVERWQRILGRPAPAPTQPGTHGRPVLAPPFVEWLMGLPDGWVTHLGLPRTVALRLLGNGVVPQQAAAALRALIVRHAMAVIR